MKTLHTKHLLNLCLCTLLGIVFAAIFYIFPNIDIVLANIFFRHTQNNQNVFIFKEYFIFTHILHTYIKYIIIVWIVFIVFQQAKYCKKHKNWYNYILIVSCLILMPLSIGLWKKYSQHACPWDLKMYGGRQLWIHYFEWPNFLQKGSCFPAGHASIGFNLIFLGLFYYPNNNSNHYSNINNCTRKVNAYLYAGCICGLCLGIVQQIRGAHFLSHTFATFWWALFLYYLLRLLLRCKR